MQPVQPLAYEIAPLAVSIRSATICRDMRMLTLALILAVIVAERPLPEERTQNEQRWLGTWFAASTGRVDAPAASVTTHEGLPVGGQSPLHFSNQTLRQIARITLGGSRFRVVLSNTFGTAPLTIGAAQVALRDKDAAIVPRSNRVLTFGGVSRAAVPAGAMLVSDPVDLVAPDFADLAIDLYLPDDMAAMKSPITMHPA